LDVWVIELKTRLDFGGYQPIRNFSKFRIIFGFLPLECVAHADNLQCVSASYERIVMKFLKVWQMV